MARLLYRSPGDRKQRACSETSGCRRIQGRGKTAALDRLERPGADGFRALSK